MWPFRKREQFALPPWTFEMAHDPVDLRVVPGRWLITDGADRSNAAVLMGDLPDDRMTLTPEFDGEGITRLTVTWTAQTEREVPVDEQEIVVDSGDLVICCEMAFENASIARGDSAFRLISSAHREWEDAFVILIRDAQSRCVGILAVPRWGDGCYKIQTRWNGTVCEKQIGLQESL